MVVLQTRTLVKRAAKRSKVFDDGELVLLRERQCPIKKTRTDKFGGRFTASVTLHTQ